MINVSINNQDLQRLQQVPGLLQTAMHNVTRAIANRGAAHLRDADDTPRWTNNLADGITAITLQNGAAIVAPADYAEPVHDGRTPGAWPSSRDDLADWVKDHGLPDEALFPIARKIKNRGIKARPFMKNFASSMAFEAIIKSAIQRELADVA